MTYGGVNNAIRYSQIHIHSGNHSNGLLLHGLPTSFPLDRLDRSMIEKRKRRWCFMDLVLDHQTGKLRETALWSNIGKAAMTWGFVYTVLHDKGSEWLWLAYGSIVVASEAVARVLNQKQQALNSKEDHAPDPAKKP